MRTAPLLALIVALGGLAGCADAGGTRGVVTERAPARMTRDRGALRVMTFNLRVDTWVDGRNRWERRRDAVADRIRSWDPDLLGTQEGQDAMLTFLRGRLDDYGFYGAGRDDGRRSGEMCGVFYRTSRFERLDGGHFWLSATPDTPGSRGWGATFPRMVTWVKLKPRGGGGAFVWLNTHFDAWNARARAESARLLRARLSVLAGTLPCLVTGDFNAAPDSAPYRTLVGEPAGGGPRLRDVYRAAHPVAGRGEGTVHLFTGWRGGPRMDWILASPEFVAVDAVIDTVRGPQGYPSDHFPVVATVRQVGRSDR